LIAATIAARGRAESKRIFT